jgi:hypothetical protein
MTTTAPEETGRASAVLAKMAATVDGMDLRTMGTVLVKSGYFQDTRDIAQVVVKVMAGRELGFGPIASMQGVYIVKGRVSLASNLIAAAIQRSGRFRYRVSKLDRSGCNITFYERWDGQWTEVGESTFNGQDAEAAGLAKGDNYRAFPRNMYFARALTNGARWYCPEVFNGPVYTPDELGARVDDDGQVIDIPAAPPMDSEETKRLAADYDRTIGAQAEAMLPMRERDVEDRAANPSPAAQQGREEADQPATSSRRPTRADLWAEKRRLANKAIELGLQGVPTIPQRAGDDVLVAANADLAARIRAHEAGLVATEEPLW